MQGNRQIAYMPMHRHAAIFSVNPKQRKLAQTPHATRLHSMLKVTRRINASLDSKKVYREIVNAAIALLGVDGAALRLLKPDGNSLELAASAGKIRPERLSRVLIGNSVTGRAAAEKKTVSVDVTKIDYYKGTSGFRFISVAPVLLREEGGRLLGVLNTYHQKGGPFSSEKLEVLSILAEHAANAAHNAALHEELTRKNADLEEASHTDFLTGLHNKKFFNEVLEKTLANSKRYKQVFSIAIGDLNKFKALNDELGHSAGDAVMAALGKILKKSVREGDVVTRWGGDEFAFILPNTDAKGAEAFAEKIKSCLSAFCEGNEGRVLLNGRKIGISLGTAAFGAKEKNAEKTTADDLMLRADKALYRAKKGKHGGKLAKF